MPPRLLALCHIMFSPLAAMLPMPLPSRRCCRFSRLPRHMPAAITACRHCHTCLRYAICRQPMFDAACRHAITSHVCRHCRLPCHAMPRYADTPCCFLIYEMPPAPPMPRCSRALRQVAGVSPLAAAFSASVAAAILMLSLRRC